MEEFDFVPLYSWQMTTGYRVLVTEMESGPERRYYKRRRPREWMLGFIGTPGEIEEIEKFYCRHKGPFGSFLWALEKEKSAVCVRFKDEQLTIRGHGTHVKECSLTLIEVM